LVTTGGHEHRQAQRSRKVVISDNVPFKERLIGRSREP
jgi:hypothetical protein